MLRYKNKLTDYYHSHLCCWDKIVERQIFKKYINDYFDKDDFSADEFFMEILYDIGGYEPTILLHVVVDDGNFDDGSIKWQLEQLDKPEYIEGYYPPFVKAAKRFLKYALSIPEPERNYLWHNDSKYRCDCELCEEYRCSNKS